MVASSVYNSPFEVEEVNHSLSNIQNSSTMSSTCTGELRGILRHPHEEEAEIFVGRRDFCMSSSRNGQDPVSIKRLECARKRSLQASLASNSSNTNSSNSVRFTTATTITFHEDSRQIKTQTRDLSRRSKATCVITCHHQQQLVIQPLHPRKSIVSSSGSFSSLPPRSKQRKKVIQKQEESVANAMKQLLYTGKTSKCNNNSTRNHQNHHQNPQDPNQYTPSMELIALIHAACTKGDYLVLKQILALKKQRSYAVANCSCSCGLTPLQIACFEGHLRLVKLLLEYQGDPNKCGNPIEIKRHMSASTKTPLVYASAHANAELVSVLLENGATFEVDALMEACRHGHIQVVQLLLLASKKQLDMDTLYKAVSFCVSNANGKNLLTVLLEDGQSFESRKKIFSCLFLAFSHSHASILKAFVEIYSQEIIQKAVKLHSHVRPLHLASTKGCSQSVDLLLKMGFPPDEIDPARGITPLFLACARGHSDVVDRLLQAGANVFVMGPNQETPLHIAAQENHFNCVELLLSNASRVEVDALTQDKCTPLHLASQRGNTRVVQCLLLHGAQVNALTSSNETPLIKASRMSYTETVKVLLAHHAKQSPVQHAPTNGILEPVAIVDTTNTIKDQEEEEEVMIFLAKSHRRMSLSKWLKNVVNRK